MKKADIQTIKKLTNHLHGVYDATNETMEKQKLIDTFNVDSLKGTRKHLEVLEKVVGQIKVLKDGTLEEEIKGYISLKSDTVNEIIALELLVYEKKKTYHQMLVKSNREYEKLSSSTENLQIKRELRKELADEIYKFKIYLTELLDLTDRKRTMLTQQLMEHQQKNREIVEVLEKRGRRNILSGILPEKFALVQ